MSPRNKWDFRFSGDDKVFNKGQEELAQFYVHCKRTMDNMRCIVNY